MEFKNKFYSRYHRKIKKQDFFGSEAGIDVRVGV
jgi:hypothetical protein